MHCRVFTVRFSPKQERFDDEEITAFLVDKDLVEVRDHFFVRDGTPYLALVVLYNGLSSGEEGDSADGKRERKPDYRELLSEADWAVFNRLREWRNEKGKEEGVPPYVLFTNRQLALAASKRPENLTALGELEGIGAAKVEKLGEAILGIIHGVEPEPREDAE